MNGQRRFPPRVPAPWHGTGGAGSSAAEPDTSGDLAREIELWTTRDGREIPLDDMSDEHVANALRVLSNWRTGVKKIRPDDPVLVDLAAAISRFKQLDRARKRAARKAEPRDAMPSTTERTARKSQWPKRPMRAPVKPR
jgi:hypothetical protein